MWRLARRLPRWGRTDGAGPVRQHKDDFSNIVHLPAGIILIFREHNGVRQLDPPVEDGGRHGNAPSALAVLRLITSSNLVARSIGMSVGLAPRRANRHR